MMITLVSGAHVSLVAAACLAVAFLALWLMRLVTAERHNGSGGGVVRRSRRVTRLDVALTVMGAALVVALVARVVLVLAPGRG